MRTLVVLLLCSAPLCSRAGIEVRGASATQALLSYEVPGGGPCSIEASESLSMRPLVHDVDPVLFPGSDRESGSGTSRSVVLGKRRTDVAADGNNYSRALQALTQHYVRITCGSLVLRGSFATENIPIGATFNDGPQIDPANPGKWLMPTRFEDRQQTIVDPHTGALLHAVSLAAESYQSSGYNGIFLFYGGFVRMCADKLVGPPGGPLGFVCSLNRYGQGGNVAYWIVPSTGETRILGDIPISQGGVFGAVTSDLRTYGPDDSGNLVWANYVGNFRPATQLPIDGWHQYSTVPMSQMIHDFDPSYPVDRGCNQAWAGAGEYKLVVCGTGQDLPGWLAVLYGGDGRAIEPGCSAGDACPRIVAAADIFNIPASQFCTLHNVQQMDDVASINVQVNPTGPRCVAMGHMVYWRFKTDPHGAALVVDQFFDGGGHWDHGPLGRVSEDGSGWATVIGAPPEAHLDEPITRLLNDSPFFAGARGLSWGSTTSKHPSYHQLAGVAPSSETSWLLDMMPFDGGQFYSTPSGATLISGNLYKYDSSTEQPSAFMARKRSPTLAASGGRSLLDVSGPTSLLSDQKEDDLKYCVALLAGECRPDSAAGDIYVNASGVVATQCAASDGPVPDRFDLCVGNLGSFHQAMVQVDVTAERRVRPITHGLAGIRNSFFYSTAKSLPDASWALFSWGNVQPAFGGLTNVWMAKLTPLVEDGVDRSTFKPLIVSVTPPPGTVSAAVEFGYAENGDPGQYYCTSRRESCLAISASLDEVNPFAYPSENVPALSCATNCSIAVPVVPGRMVFYREAYFDAGGTRIGVGPDRVGN